MTAFDSGSRIWDVVDRQPIMLEHGQRVAAVAFSPDGHRVATASDDGSARLWDVASNKQSAALTHLGAVQGVAFSADGARLLTWSFDRSVRVWDRDGHPVAMKVHNYIVWHAALSPDGRRVISAGASDNSAWIWDASTGNDLIELKVGDPLECAAFSADGKMVVTGSRKGSARLWDVESGRVIAEMPHLISVKSAIFSPDGRRIVTASWDWHVRVWNVSDGRKLAEMKHDDSVLRAVFNPDGRYVLSASIDKTARLWDAATGSVPLFARTRWCFREPSGDPYSALLGRWASHIDDVY